MVRTLALALALAAAQDDSPGFEKDQRLAAAYYYPGPDARPAADLAEMGKAGIDVALVEAPAPAGFLDQAVAALDALEKDRQKRPRLAPFLKAGAKPDFAEADRFVERAARHAARIDGRPLLWLAPALADPEPARAAFEEALGALKNRPYLVAELSWKNAPADRTYAWGATRGYAIDLPVVTVGPGTLNRDDGKVYERAWYKALKLEPRVVVVETWNGAADGVSETPERKRKYLDATRRHVRDFKDNEKISLPKGKWTAATQVAYTLMYTPHEQGLRPVATDDGPFDEVRTRGFSALSTKEVKGSPVRHLCFDVDDSFCYFDKRGFEVTVEFMDLGEGIFALEYDSGDRTLPADQRVLKKAGTARFTGSGEWRNETFSLPDAVFGNGQPGGSDFRFTLEKRGLAVRSIMVIRK